MLCTSTAFFKKKIQVGIKSRIRLGCNLVHKYLFTIGKSWVLQSMASSNWLGPGQTSILPVTFPGCNLALEMSDKKYHKFSLSSAM